MPHDITICQNFFDSDKNRSDCQGHLFAPYKFAGSTVSRLEVMSNCFIGYNDCILYTYNDPETDKKYPDIGILDKSGNLFASKDGGNSCIAPEEPLQ